MLEQIKNDWQEVKRGEPGRRFRECYERQRRRGGPFAVGRLVTMATGILVALGGLLLVPAPGPGWAIVFLGIALLATTWRPAARLLDWVEPKLLAAWEYAKKWWARASLAAKLALVGIAGLATLGVCYVAYTLFFSK